ncbi:MAG: sigma-54 dependent transcriptional regulator [Candidatus Riflebacteria bacterium]|nr:sigma-54 dependent transcriptional regulator [Candidatus Riflebacteria bacterium]
MKILVVDDNASLARAIKTFLNQEGHIADVAGSVKEGQKLLAMSNYDLVITDLKLPDGEGLDIIRLVRAFENKRLPEVILMTAFGSVESAVTAMQLGASDYLTKPVSMEEFSFRIQKIADHRRLDDENDLLKRQCKSLLDVAGFGNALDDIVGCSAAATALKQLIARVAPFPSTVLITGETGSGKEMVARAIHQLSPRVNGPFVRVNCASIPETLFEAELFGHEKGAFTDARQKRTGSFEAADQGTVFLDEVGEIPLAMQAKLLRVLQEKEVLRIGSSLPVKVDVRIVAATNRNLEKMVTEGTFREDLLYRLSVFNIVVPPLRERKDDFGEICRSLLVRLGKELGKPSFVIGDDLIQRLSCMIWPGNVRQLKNVLERAMVLSEGREIDGRYLDNVNASLEAAVDSLSQPATDAPVQDGDAGLIQALEDLERRMIEDALQKANGTKSRAADLLKIPRTQLLYRMKKLGLGEIED